MLSLPCPACFSAGVASLASGFVLGLCTLPRVLWKCLWTRSFPAVLAQVLGLLFWCFERWSWWEGPLGDSEGLMELNKCFHGPSNRLHVAKLLMVVSLLAKCSHRRRFAALGRLRHAWGPGNGMWCHDEAHRTRHHRLHEETSSRS